MPDVHVAAKTAFADQISNDVVGLTDENSELHIIADEWTLVLTGDPLESVLIALDDEQGAPAALLQNTLADDELAAMRDLNNQLDGALQSRLEASPDPLAKALAGLLTD